MTPAASVAALVVLGAATFGCGSGAHLSRYHDSTLSFSYPADWQARYFTVFVPQTVARTSSS